MIVVTVTDRCPPARVSERTVSLTDPNDGRHHSGRAESPGAVTRRRVNHRMDPGATTDPRGVDERRTGEDPERLGGGGHSAWPYPVAAKIGTYARMPLT
jgi:hypothetical protein